MLTFFIVWVIIIVILIVVARISFQRMLAEGLREWEEEVASRKRLEEDIIQENRERNLLNRINELELREREKTDKIDTLERTLRLMDERGREYKRKVEQLEGDKKYIISGEEWQYECGDGCCDDWGYSVSINGKEITRDADYDLQDLKQIMLAVGISEENIVFARDIE